MWSTSKRDRFLRSALQITNCAACITIIYIYITYIGTTGNANGILPGNIIRSEKFTNEPCTDVCDSRACLWHANMLHRYMDTSYDPCDDFGSFLCGGFIAQFGYDDINSVFSEAAERMMTTLKGVLDNIEADPHSASGKMKTVYDSCINYGSSELQGMTDFKDLLNDFEIFNWPDLREDFRFNNISPSEIFGNLIVLISSKYISFQDIPGNETYEKFVPIEFFQYEFKASTNLTRESAVSKLEHFDLDDKSIDIVIEDYNLVKNAVLKLYEDNERCNNTICTDFFFDCARQTDDDWEEFCHALGFILNFNNSTDRMLIAIRRDQVVFFKKLLPLLHSVPNRSLANFVALSLLKQFQAELSFYFRLSKRKYLEFVDSDLIIMDRWKYCIWWIAYNMELSLKNEVFHHYLTKSVTEEMVNIYKDYHSKLIDMIILQEWIPNVFKSAIVEPLRNISFNIDVMRKTFPNDTYLNKIYEKFEPVRESFFRNVVRIRRFESILQVPEEILPLEEYAIRMTHFEMQASFAPPILAIHFGMLIPPFYVPGYINIVNRVLLAAIIGHEFGHKINGDVHNVIPWKHYQKEKCIRDQFSRFKFKYLNESLQGFRYDMENIPDNIAMNIIEKVIEEHSSSQDITLPGLPYSLKQILYMSSVQMWCSKSNLKTDLYYKKVDFHAPSEFRLLGIMQNSRGPSEAFNCTTGSFMNPATKCSFLEK